MERLLKQILKRLNKFLFEDFADTEADSSRRLMLTYVVAIIGAIIFGVYSIYTVIAKTYALFIIDGITAILFIFTAIRLPKAKDYKNFSTLLLIVLTLSLTAIFIALKPHSLSILFWYPLFPFISILILGRKKGFNFSASLLVFIAAIYIAQRIWLTAAFTGKSMASFAGAYIVTFLLVYYSDMLRHNITKKLVKSNLELKSAQRKLVKLNKLDKLSGVYNRNFLEDFYNSTACTINGESNICILMMDIDNFKSYNDTYGHINGDKVISAVANVIKNTCREDDIIVRYGGEEFLAILFGRSMEEGEYIANLIIEGVHNLEIEHKHSKTNYVTVSIGLSGCCYDDKVNKREIIKKADGALYEAKNLGKNCCVVRRYSTMQEQE